MDLTIKLHARDDKGPAEVAVYEGGTLLAFVSGKTKEDFTEAVLLDALFKARGCGHLSLRAFVQHLRQPGSIKIDE